MKIAIVTDTHFGVRNDSHVFLRHSQKFFEDVFFPYLKKNDIDAIVHAGDVFDRRKQVGYITLDRARDFFLDRCVKERYELHVIIGNHDVPYRNTNVPNSMDELYPDTEGINVYSGPDTIRIGEVPICLVPWVNKENHDETVKIIKGTKADILIGHLELKGFDMYRGIPCQHGTLDSNLLKNFDMVLSGHFHHKSTKGNITYLGSPYEMTWADFNDERGFHVLDLSNREIEFVRNPRRVFYKVFYDEDAEPEAGNYEDCYVKVIVQNRTSDQLFDSFMESLYKSGPADVSIVEDRGSIDLEEGTEDIQDVEDTVSILDHYVDNSKTDVDKKQLKKLFHELYGEAQSVDL